MDLDGGRRKARPVSGLLNQHSDEELARLMTNLAGHDLHALLAKDSPAREQKIESAPHRARQSQLKSPHHRCPWCATDRLELP
jgi:hypothetical protein